jgi:transposase-like protein
MTPNSFLPYRAAASEVRVKVMPSEKLEEVVKKSLGELKGRLNYLERCEAVLRGQEAYEANYPHTRKGGYERAGENRGKKQKRTKCVYGESPYTKVAAAQVNLRQRTIQQDAQIAKAFDPLTRDSIRGLPLARRKGELVLLARFSNAERAALVSHVLETGASLEKAITELGLAKTKREEGEARDLRRLLKIAAENYQWAQPSSSEVVVETLEEFRGVSTAVVATLESLIAYYTSPSGTASAGRLAA